MSEPNVHFRIQALAVFFIILFAVLVAQMWNLQVLKYDYYARQIRNSSQVTVRIPSVRGEIKDRNGITLVRNRASYQVDFLLPAVVQSYKKAYGEVPTLNYQKANAHGMLDSVQESDIVTMVDSAIIPRLKEFKLDEPFSSSKMRAHFKTNPLVPFTYRQDIDFPTMAKYAERDLGLPGLQVGQKPVREYVYGALAAQLLGYVGEPRDINDLPDIGDYTYYEADVQGKTNLELTLDESLRGKPGARVLKKSVKGQIEGEIREEPPERGSDVWLTIDARIQYIAEEALRTAQYKDENGHPHTGVGRGSVVVVNPNNGEILAMVSVPSYDPNTFIPSISVKDWNKLKVADADPLTNRAISTYAPGSTYKIPIALAGLKAGHGNDTYTCTGGYRYGNTYMKCWIFGKGEHGLQTLSDALKNSCNAFFYQYGNATGINAIDSMCNSLGLGQKTGVELSYENGGVLPGPDWMKQNYPRERWSQGQTANTSIGQGYVKASPLQMAMIAATVANGGTCYYPTLIHKIVSPDGAEALRPARIRTNLLENGLTSDQIEKVRNGMRRVVNDATGTGKQAKLPNIVIAGKTGTAQFKRNGKVDNHTWFVSFAPYDKPTLAVCVFLQGAKSGGGTAGPIAARVIQETMALQTGYDPGLKPLAPAPGSYAFIDKVEFERSNLAALGSGDDDETADHTPEGDDSDADRSVQKPSDADAPDIKTEADERPLPVRKAEPVQDRRKGLFDFLLRNQQSSPKPRSPKG